MSERRSDDGVGGALENNTLLNDASGADGDDAVPVGALFDGMPFDDAMLPSPTDDVTPVWEWEAGAGLDWPPGGPPPDWPPDAVPVFLWSEEVLRQALQDAPGPRLARVVAEAIDLAGNLDPDHDAHADPSPHGGGPDSSDASDDPGSSAPGSSAPGSSVPGSDVPGSDVLGAGPLGGLSDDTLGDLMVACARIQSWSAGVQARVVAERAARESHPLAHNSLVGQVTHELVVTEPEAIEVVVRAESGTHHPTVIHALIAGRIDARKAHTLLRSAALSRPGFDGDIEHPEDWEICRHHGSTRTSCVSGPRGWPSRRGRTRRLVSGR